MRNNFLNLVAYDPIAEPCAAKTPQNTGGGTSRTKNRSVTVSLSSDTATNREMTERRPREDRETFVLRSSLLGTLKYVACLLLALVLGVGNMWAAGTVLFTQSFDETGAGSVAYTENTARAYTTAEAKKLDKIVQTGTNYFTSITCNAKSSFGIGINTSSGQGSANWTGMFGAYSNATSEYWSVVKTSNFATTAPKALKVEMNATFAIVSGGSNIGVQFAIGSGFTDGLTNSCPALNKCVAGFALPSNNTLRVAKYATSNGNTAINGSSETLTNDTKYKYTWVINNTEETLTYTGPDEKSTTVAAGCWDLWVGTTRNLAGITKSTTGMSGTEMQNLYIGSPFGKKHKFVLEDIVVTDLTPVTATYDATFSTEKGSTPDAANAASVTLAEITGVEGWKNIGWKADKATKTGTTDVAANTLIENGETITLLENTTFTAQWAQLYTVTYNKAGGEGGDVPTQEALVSGDKFEVAGQGTLTPATEGQIFRGWSDEIAATPYKEGDEYTIGEANVNFTAVWETPVNYTISLNPDGGTIASYEGWTLDAGIYSKTVTEGTEVSLLAFTKDDVQLMFFRDGSANEYSGSVTLNGDMNLSAIWGEEKEVTIYSWESPSGTAIEEGGVASYYTDPTTKDGGNERVNYANTAQGTTYHTICLNGGAGFADKQIKIALDQNIEAGDEIKMTAYFNTDNTSKKASAKMYTEAGAKIFDGDDLPNIYSEGSPVEQTYTALAGGTKNIKMTRLQTGSNTFITKLVITGTRLQEVMEPAAVPSISVQPAGASYAWNATVAALTVTASVTDGGTLSYQWYKAGEPATKVGTNSASYTPTESGTYYVVVTNSKTGFESKSATSSSAVITIAAQPSYKVTYYDGETKLGEEDVKVTESPAEYEDHQAKALYGINGLYEFNGWYSNSDLADEHKIANVAALAIGEATNIYGKWTKKYAENVDIAAYAAENVDDDSSNDAEELAAFKTWFTGKGYVHANLNGLDKTTSNNGAYAGIKTKSNAAYYAFNVPANKRVTIKLGYMAGAAEMYINGVKDETQALTGGSTGSGDNFADWHYDVTEESTLQLKIVNGGTCVLKAVTIGEIPAESDDATLSDLKVGGTTISGFSPSVTSYYVEMPYGTAKADLPLVTVTTNEEHATATIQDAKDRPDDTRATISVTAQNGVATKMYYVYFTVAPKLGVNIYEYTPAGSNGADKEASGYKGGTADINLQTSKTNGGYKLGSVGHYIGIIPEGGLKENDIICIDIADLQGASKLTFYDTKADGRTLLIDPAPTPKVGKNYVSVPSDMDQIYLYRADGTCNPSVISVTVYRHMAPFIESFEIEGIGELAINQETKAITASVPESFDVTALEPTIKAWANGSAHLDKSGAKDFTNPVTYTVTSDYAEDGEVTYTVTITKVAPSAAPVITTQPAGANYIEGASVAALEVEATGAGTLSYQWQIKNGLEFEDIDGATAASYTPTVSAIGSYIYRVVVTNTEDSKPATSVNSNEATIVIAEDPSCKAIGYGTTRDLALNTEVVIDATTGLKHKSSKDAVEGGRKIKNVSDIDGIKLDGNAYYDIYTTEMNIGSVAVSLTSNSNGTKRKFAVIFCSAAEFDAAKILGIVEQTGGAGDEEQVINTPDVPLGTKLVRIMRYYKDANNNEYGEGSSSWIYYARVCLVEPAQEVTASVTVEPASANYCPSDVVAPLAYELSMEEGASAAYQWYKGTEAIEGATDATYTPSETGVYSCKAVVTKTGRLSKELTSAEATINFYEATEITGTVNVKGDLGATTKKLSVTATGAGELTYAWYAYDNVNEIATGAKLSEINELGGLTITEETQYYQVTVTGDCGSASEILTVSKWIAVEQADVTGSMTWDWNKNSNAAAWEGVANIQLTGADRTTDIIMANSSSAMPNNEHFRSDMLVSNGEYPARPSQDNGVFQGYAIKFHTTVPGVVAVTYRGTGNSEVVKLQINEWADETGISSGKDNMPTKKMFVPAGDVTIKEKDGKVLRIDKIVFNATPDYTRNVTEGRYGTICLPNGGVMVGAELFEIAYYGAATQKVFLDNIINGEMVAGRPYIFLPKEGTTQLAVFYTDEANASQGNHNGLIGFIGAAADEYFDIPAGEGNYILQNNYYREVPTGAWARIKSNRAYIKLSAINPHESALAPGRRRISMSVYSEQIATGIENTGFESEAPRKVLINGELYIIRGEKMYDAKGQLVK